MRTLYVVEQGAMLHKHGETLVITLEGEQLLEIELHRIDTVLLFGNIQFSTQAVVELLEHGIELALLSLNGRLRGQLTPPLPKNIIMRIKQQELAGNPDATLSQAAEVVRVKVNNSLEVLKQADWRKSGNPAGSARKDITALSEKLDTVRDLEALNGFEGAIAKFYFSAFPTLLTSQADLFHGRSKRPPRDPVNALLSFGYMLLASRLQSLLDAHGFDPYLGWLHRPAYGRPSLALDFLEPYRAPWVDRWVVKMFNLRVFTAEDFHQRADGGFRLEKPALKRFFREWEKNLERENIMEKMKLQADSTARMLRGEQEFPQHPVFKAD